MEKLKVIYDGNLHCRTVSGAGEMVTDAPVGYGGKGVALSPTDALAGALGSCMFTIMAIFAKKIGFDLEGSSVEIGKEMTVVPPRRIASVSLDFYLPSGFPVEKRKALEDTIYSCPVHNSLHPDISYQVTFHYK